MEKTYHECPVCHSKLRAKNFDRHMQEQHSPEADRRKEQERKSQKEARRQIKEEGKKIVSCEICGTRLTKRNFIKHKKKVHQIFNATYPNATMSHMSSVEKRRHMNRLFGPDKEYSEDAFDRGVIIHGGAWEHGKNRKH